MKINLHSPLEEVQIQIIPLIDVIFCILTFFLLAALQFTRQQAINVDLPKANTSTTPQAQQRLIVTIDPVGQIYVEQQPINLDQLPGTLQTYFRANPTALMVSNASRTSSYDDRSAGSARHRRLLGAMQQVSRHAQEGPAAAVTSRHHRRCQRGDEWLQGYFFQ